MSQRYDSTDDGGLIWNDGQININWPIKNPIVSKRDSQHPNSLDLKVNGL